MEMKNMCKRVKVSYTLDEELVERLRQVSEKCMIPQARIVQKGIEMMLKELEGKG